MPRLRQVPRAEAEPDVAKMYDMLFGDRDPVAEPGTATGTPGIVASIVAQLSMNGINTAAHAADGHVAGKSQLACKRRCPPPFAGQQASIAAALSAWKS